MISGRRGGAVGRGGCSGCSRWAKGLIGALSSVVAVFSVVCAATADPARDLGSGSGGAEPTPLFIPQTPPEAGLGELQRLFHYLQQRDFERALPLAEELARRHQDVAMVQTLLGFALAGRQRLDEAEQAFLRAEELAPGDPSVIWGLLGVALARGDHARAVGHLERGLERRPSDLDLLLALAGLEGGQGNRQRVRRLMERAAAAHPEVIEPQLVLARLDVAEGEVQRALQRLERLAQRYAEHPARLETLARAQVAAGQPHRALQTANRLLAAQPGSAAAYALLGAVQHHLGDLEAARRAYLQVLDLEPNHVPTLRALAGLELAQGRYAAAAALGQRLQGLPGGEPLGWLIHGQAALGAGQAESAVDSLEQAYRRQPSSDAAVLLYQAYVAKQDPGRGQAVLAEHLTAHPDDDRVRMLLSDALLRAQRYAEAAAHLERLAERHAEDFVVANNLAYAWHHAGDARALAMARQAYALNPRDPRVQDTLGAVLLAEDGYEEALPLLEQAHAALPREAQVQFHLAQALIAAGHLEEAKGHLRQLLQRTDGFPGRERAAALLDALD